MHQSLRWVVYLAPFLFAILITVVLVTGEQFNFLSMPPEGDVGECKVQGLILNNVYGLHLNVSYTTTDNYTNVANVTVCRLEEILYGEEHELYLQCAKRYSLDSFFWCIIDPANPELAVAECNYLKEFVMVLSKVVARPCAAIQLIFQGLGIVSWAYLSVIGLRYIMLVKQDHGKEQHGNSTVDLEHEDGLITSADETQEVIANYVAEAKRKGSHWNWLSKRYSRIVWIGTPGISWKVIVDVVFVIATLDILFVFSQFLGFHVVFRAEGAELWLEYSSFVLLLGLNVAIAFSVCFNPKSMALVLGDHQELNAVLLDTTFDYLIMPKICCSSITVHYPCHVWLDFHSISFRSPLTPNLDPRNLLIFEYLSLQEVETASKILNKYSKH